MNALDTALYGALSGSTALTTLLASSTSIYHELAPRGAAFPYVIFQLQGGGHENICPMTLRNLVITIKAVSDQSAKAAGAIDAQIEALLHNGTLSVSGWTQLWLMREGDVEFAEVAPDGGYIWHAGGLYRIRLGKQ